MKRALAVVALLLAAPAEADILDDCIEAQDLDQVVADCTVAIDIGRLAGPMLGEAHAARAHALARGGDPAGAIADFDSAIALQPDRSEFIGDRGFADHSLGDYARAIQDYDAALAINRDDARVLTNRGGAYCAAGRAAPALRDRHRAIELGAASAEDWQAFLRARSYYEGASTGTFDEATLSALRDYVEAGCV